MASEELQRLWRLAQIDRQLVEVRSRAATLNVGQRQQAEIDTFSGRLAEVTKNLKEAEQQVTDLELKQKGDDQKRAKIQSEIYGGKIINPREVANLEKEIEMIKKHQDEDSEKLLELYDLLPELTAAHKEVADKVAKLTTERDQHRKTGMVEKAKLEAEFKDLSARRPDALRGISPTLMGRYDNIRHLHGGIGMVEVVKKTGNCGGCGTHLPQRTVSLVVDDRVAICEDCHRLLYYTHGVV